MLVKPVCEEKLFRRKLIYREGHGKQNYLFFFLPETVGLHRGSEQDKLGIFCAVHHAKPLVWAWK